MKKTRLFIEQYHSNKDVYEFIMIELVLAKNQKNIFDISKKYR